MLQHQRHELPTHLNIEDKAFYGLSARQFMFLIIGLAGGYGLFNQFPELVLVLRIGLAVMCLLVATLLALIRPHGRGLEEWAFVLLHYASMPKICVWRPREPELSQWRTADAGWAELAPGLTWGNTITESEEQA